VTDDDGHRLVRGQRMAVCDKTFKISGSPPYRDHFELLPPHQEVPLGRHGVKSCFLPFLRSNAGNHPPLDDLDVCRCLTAPNNFHATRLLWLPWS